MKFVDFEYQRPDIEGAEAEVRTLLGTFANADADEQIRIVGEINQIRSRLSTLENMVYIRHTVDTTDAFYKAEQDYFDGFSPHIDAIRTELYRALLSSPHHDKLETTFGKHLMNLAKVSLNTFSNDVMEDLQRENRLVSEYGALIASAQIPFDGKTLTLSEMSPYLQDKNRDVRREASKAMWAFYAENAKALDTQYDELVMLRTRIAKKLGYPTFTALAYDRLKRTDYGAAQVKVFRDQVAKHIVPVATKLFERQRQRIGVDKLHHYDEGFNFPSGNANPHGNPDWIVDKGRKMYEELSPETNEFFTFMLDHKLMDLVAKKGKRIGGYCTELLDYRAPFIFSNFNGTSHDVTVLTHEAGHAFQYFRSRQTDIPEYTFPTYEACEIHSMSMEFLTWPWMDLFFEEETEKFKFEHLANSLIFIPYGVAVDEFQHFVYDHPEATPDQRKSAWLEIEKKYLPHRSYDGNAFLEGGGVWQRQPHIYNTPFYYIDYTLAQLCAFQFWKKSRENPEQAFADYLRLCDQGGSQSFVDLVQVAGLTSPFDEACIESVIEDIEAYLNSIDDTKL